MPDSVVPVPQPLSYVDAVSFLENGGAYLDHEGTTESADKSFVIPFLEDLNRRFETASELAFTSDQEQSPYSVFVNIAEGSHDEFVNYLQDRIQQYDGDVAWRVDEFGRFQLDFIPGEAVKQLLRDSR